MKNFNILGVRWKVRLLEGRGFTKNENRGGKFRKRGGGDAWIVY